jgi:RHS repeat-associated protein
VKHVVDVSSGAAAQRLDYDEWGQVVADSSPGFQPFGFAGGVYDADTALTHFGYRDYDARYGVWTSKDPIRLEGGLGEYVYAENGPVEYMDTAGLRPGQRFAGDNSSQQAAIDAIRFIFPDSQRSGLEFGGIICREPSGSTFASSPVKGTAGEVMCSDAKCPVGSRPVGKYHTHPDKGIATTPAFRLVTMT